MKKLKPQFKRESIFVKSDKHVLFGIFVITLLIFYSYAPGDNFFTRFDNAVAMMSVMVFSKGMVITIFFILGIWFVIWLNLRLLRSVYHFIKDKN